MKVQKIAHHRNGVSGESFYVVTFKDDGDALVGVVFEAARHVAVFDVALLAAGEIEFGVNSWRGDVYEKDLRAAIEAWESKRAVRHVN